LTEEVIAKVKGGENKGLQKKSILVGTDHAWKVFRPKRGISRGKVKQRKRRKLRVLQTENKNGAERSDKQTKNKKRQGAQHSRWRKIVSAFT